MPLSAIGGHWGLLIAFGVITLAIGVMALVWPGATLLIIAVLFAIQLLVAGVVYVVRSFSEHETSGGWRVLHGLVGALSFLVGLLLLREPLQTLAIIALLIGAWWVVSGVLMTVSAFTGSTANRAWALVSGVISVIAGFIVLLQPAISLTVLVVVLGIVLIVQGALAIWGGVSAKRASVPA
jgi:uncharacterized membrane protein HdeD (DUF308 family)